MSQISHSFISLILSYCAMVINSYILILILLRLDDQISTISTLSHMTVEHLSRMTDRYPDLGICPE